MHPFAASPTPGRGVFRSLARRFPAAKGEGWGVKVTLSVTLSDVERHSVPFWHISRGNVTIS